MTQYQIYTEAVRQMETAVAELDQAHATLRDIGLQDYTAAWKGGKLSISTLYKRADELLTVLRRVECDECGRPLADHAQDVSNCDQGVY